MKTAIALLLACALSAPAFAAPVTVVSRGANTYKIVLAATDSVGIQEYGYTEADGTVVMWLLDEINGNGSVVPSGPGCEVVYANDGITPVGAGCDMTGITTVAITYPKALQHGGPQFIVGWYPGVTTFKVTSASRAPDTQFSLGQPPLYCYGCVQSAFSSPFPNLVNYSATNVAILHVWTRNYAGN